MVFAYTDYKSLFLTILYDYLGRIKKGLSDDDSFRVTSVWKRDCWVSLTSIVDKISDLYIGKLETLILLAKFWIKRFTWYLL